MFNTAHIHKRQQRLKYLYVIKVYDNRQQRSKIFNIHIYMMYLLLTYSSAHILLYNYIYIKEFYNSQSKINKNLPDKITSIIKNIIAFILQSLLRLSPHASSTQRCKKYTHYNECQDTTLIELSEN